MFSLGHEATWWDEVAAPALLLEELVSSTEDQTATAKGPRFEFMCEISHQTAFSRTLPATFEI